MFGIVASRYDSKKLPVDRLTGSPAELVPAPAGPHGHPAEASTLPPPPSCCAVAMDAVPSYRRYTWMGLVGSGDQVVRLGLEGHVASVGGGHRIAGVVRSSGRGRPGGLRPGAAEVDQVSASRLQVDEEAIVDRVGVPGDDAVVPARVQHVLPTGRDGGDPVHAVDATAAPDGRP